MKEMINFLEKLPEEKWQTKVNEEWTIKEVVSHLVGWNWEAKKVIEEIWKTGQDPWFLNHGNYDEFNKQSVDRYKRMKPGELLWELKKSEKELSEEIQRYGAENLRKRKGFFWLFEEDDECHSLKHLKQIKTALAER